MNRSDRNETLEYLTEVKYLSAKDAADHVDRINRLSILPKVIAERVNQRMAQKGNLILRPITQNILIGSYSEANSLLNAAITYQAERENEITDRQINLGATSGDELEDHPIIRDGYEARESRKEVINPLLDLLDLISGLYTRGERIEEIDPNPMKVVDYMAEAISLAQTFGSKSDVVLGTAAVTTALMNYPLSRIERTYVDTVINQKYPTEEGEEIFEDTLSDENCRNEIQEYRKIVDSYDLDVWKRLDRVIERGDLNNKLATREIASDYMTVSKTLDYELTCLALDQTIESIGKLAKASPKMAKKYEAHKIMRSILQKERAFLDS